MKALLMTSDPYEPSGVIGLFETEEQRQAIITGYAEKERQWCIESCKTGLQYTAEAIEQLVNHNISELKEIEIPIGVYGEYY